MDHIGERGENIEVRSLGKVVDPHGRDGKNCHQEKDDADSNLR
jgi:hypothetical protein